MATSIDLPASLDDMVVPSGVSGVDSAMLNDAFHRLDEEIIALSRKVDAHRQYYFEKTNDSRSSKCHTVCQQLTGDRKLKCLKQCTRPVVPLESMEELALEFPIDAKRLQEDSQLRQNFERHQRAPETIEESDAEASLIADMYAMPIATAAIPEESWARSMDLIKMDRFEPQRDTLVRNWKYRADSYSNEAKEELSRKINRHDSEQVILKASRKRS